MVTPWLGKSVPFTLTSPNLPGVTRTYTRWEQLVPEMVGARVWSGIHFRAADVQGSVIGKKVAHLLERNYFQPVD